MDRYQGAVTAVRTTGIFCRPECPSRPKAENTVRYASGEEALVAGFRPCTRCRPFGTPPEGAERVTVARLETPLGPMIGAATSRHLILLEFADRRMLRTQIRRVGKAFGWDLAPGMNAVLRETQGQLDGYFAGRRRTFTVPMRTPGTSFQTRVWSALQRIRYGTTRSYAQLAKAVRQPAAVRAVAGANGDNRISIMIPCHRVIGSDGSLTGYGGRLWRKRWLLDLESPGDTGRRSRIAGTAGRRRRG